jgi:hypothetical protein
LVRAGSYRPVANSSLANRLQMAGKTIDWHPDRPGHEKRHSGLRLPAGGRQAWAGSTRHHARCGSVPRLNGDIGAVEHAGFAGSEVGWADEPPIPEVGSGASEEDRVVVYAGQVALLDTNGRPRTAPDVPWKCHVAVPRRPPNASRPARWETRLQGVPLARATDEAPCRRRCAHLPDRRGSRPQRR